MLSIVAFAAAPFSPTQLKAVANKDHSITIEWKAVDGLTYNVYLDGTKQTKEISITDNIASITLEPEKATSLEIEAVNDSNEVSEKTSFGWNAILDATKASNDSDFDNGIINANKSGEGVGGQTANFNQVIKSQDLVTTAQDGKQIAGQTTHRTHGEYQNNTNSCASCHQTHTAASKNLLFKDGVYTTCTACHDGTLGFYNVFGKGSDGAGTFGGTHDGNMSIHMANGAVSVKAAPGGNKNGDGSWSEEFTCASCHAPHGSYSDRLLNFNPNGMGNTPVDEGGKKLTNVPVVSTLPADGKPNYVVYKFTATGTDIVKPDYAAKKVAVGNIVYQLMSWDGSKYVEEKDPWLHGYDWADGHAYKIYWSSLQGSITMTSYDKDGNATTADKDTSILNTDSIKDGYMISGNGFFAVNNPSKFSVTTDNKNTSTDTSDDVKLSGTALLDKITYANIARAYIVKLDMVKDNELSDQYKLPLYTTNVKSLWAGKQFAGYGVAMNKFCSSCHTDYLAASGSASGTWNTAYRHSTNSDSYTCVRCHYAHGTDVTVMKDARSKNLDDIVADNTYFPEVTGTAAREAKAKEYLLDKDPSSALKRYTNMSVCWGCHTSSHSEGFRNGSTFDNQSGAGGSYDKVGLQNGW